MRALYTGQDTGLRAAAAYINDRLNADRSFWDQIRAKPSFDLATITPAEVADTLQSSTSAITVVLWTPKPAVALRYRKTIALVDSRYPRKLFYHTKFQSRRVGQKVNTIVHEYVHSVDAFDDGHPGTQMGHGDNSSEGKEDTAAYWIGDLAESVYGGASLFGAGLGSLIIETGNSDDGVVVEEEQLQLGSYDEEYRPTLLSEKSGIGLAVVAVAAVATLSALAASVYRRGKDD